MTRDTMEGLLIDTCQAGSYCDKLMPVAVERSERMILLECRSPKKQAKGLWYKNARMFTLL